MDGLQSHVDTGTPPPSRSGLTRRDYEGTMCRITRSPHEPNGTRRSDAAER